MPLKVSLPSPVTVPDQIGRHPCGACREARDIHLSDSVDGVIRVEGSFKRVPRQDRVIQLKKNLPDSALS
jgi:hypothetical protein